jgi:hypothetical protein
MNECPRLDMGLVVRSRILRFLIVGHAGGITCGLGGASTAAVRVRNEFRNSSE